jgi:hypothetical protein
MALPCAVGSATMQHHRFVSNDLLSVLAAAKIGKSINSYRELRLDRNSAEIASHEVSKSAVELMAIRCTGSVMIVGDFLR